MGDVGVDIKVLDGLAVVSDGNSLVVTRAQARHVLYLLSAWPRWVSDRRLVDALWPESPPAKPEQQLRVAVRRLREALNDDDHVIVERGPFGYRLNPEVVSVDLWSWRALVTAGHASVANSQSASLTAFEDARRLWTGQPFEDAQDCAILDGVVADLKSTRADADLAEARLLVGEGLLTNATFLLEAASARYPTHEGFASLRMQALAGTGRTTDGLAVASDLRRLLREVGMSPSVQFQTFESDWLAGKTTGSITPGLSVLSRRRPWRESLRTALANRVTTALAERDQLAVVVTAPRRQGLSSFLEGLGASMPRSVDIEYVKRIPTGPTHSLALLAGDLTAVLPTTIVDSVRQRAFDRGLVLIVDDIDKLDQMSIDALKLLEAEMPPGFAIVAGASGELNGSLDLKGFEIEPLGPLERSDVAALLKAAHADMPSGERTHQAERILAWGRGELSATRESVRSVRTGEDTKLPIATATRNELAGLFGSLETTVGVLVAQAAELGTEIDRRMVADVTGRSTKSVDDAILRATAAGITELSESPGSARFVSEMTRAVLVEVAPQPDSARLHHSAAETLREHGGDLLDIAKHLRDAGSQVDDSAVAAISTIAAAEASKRGRHGQAAMFWHTAAERTVDEPARRSYLLDQALCLDKAGLINRADAILKDLVGQAESSSSFDLLARAALAGDGHSGQIGGQTPRRERLTIAKSGMPTTHPMTDEVLCELAYEVWAARMRLTDELDGHVRRVAGDDQSSAWLLARRLLLALEDYEGIVEFEAAACLVEDALRDDRKVEAKVQGRCLVMAVYVALTSGHWTEADEWITQMQDLAEVTDEPRLQWQSLAYRSALLNARGLAASGAKAADDAFHLGVTRGVPNALETYGLHSLSQSFLAESMWCQAANLELVHETMQYPVLYALRGLAAIDSGEERPARERLREALIERHDEIDPFRAPWLAFTSLLAVVLGQVDEAKSAAKLLQPRAGTFLFFGNGGSFIGPVDWFRGRVAELAGDRDAANRLYRNATMLAKNTGADAWLRSPYEQITLR